LQGSVQKWTAYTSISKVTKENQWIDINKEDRENNNKASIDGKLTELVTSIVTFTDERKWSQFDMPRNLILGLVTEVGELAELLVWDGDITDVKKLWNSQDHQVNKVAQEIADICIYILKLANALNMVDDLENTISEGLFLV